MKNLICTTLLLGLCTSAATASTLSFSGSSTDETSIALEQFDPGLGTLNYVSYSILGGGDVDEFREFALGQAAQFEVAITGTLEFLGDTDTDGGFQIVDEGICDRVDGCQFFAQALFTASLFGFLETGFDDLSPFVGTDVLTATLIADTDSLVLQYSIDYEFIPTVVPLPASLPLLLVGLGAFGAARRRKMQNI